MLCFVPSYCGNRSGRRSPPWGVNPLRVDVHLDIVLLCLVTKLLLKVSQPMLTRTLWLSGDGTRMVHALVCPPKGERPPGVASFLSVEGSCPRWANYVDSGVHPCMRRLIWYHGDHGDYACSCRRVPMPGIDGLATDARELLYQARMGVYSYILSCQALNDVTSQEPSGHGACLVLKSPRVTRRVHNEQTGGKIMSVHDRGGEGLAWFIPESSSF
jgi:hypothetical protein